MRSMNCPFLLIWDVCRQRSRGTAGEYQLCFFSPLLLIFANYISWGVFTFSIIRVQEKFNNAVVFLKNNVRFNLASSISG